MDSTENPQQSSENVQERSERIELLDRAMQQVEEVYQNGEILADRNSDFLKSIEGHIDNLSQIDNASADIVYIADMHIPRINGILSKLGQEVARLNLPPDISAEILQTLQYINQPASIESFERARGHAVDMFGDLVNVFDRKKNEVAEGRQMIVGDVGEHDQAAKTLRRTDSRSAEEYIDSARILSEAAIVDDISITQTEQDISEDNHRRKNAFSEILGKIEYPGDNTTEQTPEESTS